MKIDLTAGEMELVTNAEILILKNRVLKKVHLLFENVANSYSISIVGKLSNVNNLSGAKISRGDNYLGLPYIILDYPRQFSKNDILAIRTFFWWGNFFSITLHLSGKYQEYYSESLQRAFHRQLLRDWYICNSADQWQHHFEEDNYTRLANEDDVDFNSLPFIKLAKKIPLMQWELAEDFFVENFLFLVNILQPMLQSDGKDL